MKDWETAVAPRAGKRSDYPAGPGSGPGIFNTYRTLFKRAISGKSQPAAMILGATPELRDLALSHGCHTIAVDVSAKVMKDMTLAMEHQDDPDEEQIIGDWLKNPIEDNKVDVVIGDGIGNNVPYADYPQLFSEINRVLKPGGYLILREMFNDPDHPRRTIRETIEYVHKEGLHKYDLFFELYCYTTDGGGDPKNKLISMKKVQKKLEQEIYNKGILTPEEEDSLKTFMDGSVTTTFRTEGEYLPHMEPYFDPIEIVDTEGFRFCEYFKFFFAKNKK